MIDYTNSSTIYISATKGNDSYTGFAPHPTNNGLGMIQGPVKSFRRVNELLMGMRVPARIQPITVCIEGDHFLSDPISLGPMPRTMSENYKFCDITFESYGEKRARLIGGRRLEGFTRDRFRGVDCLSLYISEVKNGSWHFTDLYVNGKRASVARYPREGTLQALDTEINVPGCKDLHNGSRWFIADKRDLEDIEGIEHAIVSFYNFWVDEHSPVESYDRETGKLVMKYRSRYKNSTNYGNNDPSAFNYYLENVPVAFGAPNDWYLDVQNGMLYYVPEEIDTDPASLEILAPTIEQIAIVEGKPDMPVSGIRFRGLDFICSRGDYASKTLDPSGVPEHIPTPDGYASDSQSASDAYGAIRFSHAINCSIEDCTFTALGLHAIEILEGCCGIRIERSCFSQLGGGGVKIFGVTDDNDNINKTSHCSITGNKISQIGLRYAAATGIIVCYASYNEISDNEISYTQYSGISVGWVWGYAQNSCYGNIIRRNHIHHIGVGLLSDMGGIYLLGMQSGTIVSDNYIHDVICAHYGGHGIYTDEGSSYITIERNIVVNCSSSCFFQHYGAHNTVRDNVFAFGHDGVISTGTGRTDGHVGVIFENNTVVADGDQPIYHANSPAVFTCIFRASRNCFWHADGHEPVIMAVKTPDGVQNVCLSEWQSECGMDIESYCQLPKNLEIDGKALTVKPKAHHPAFVLD